MYFFKAHLVGILNSQALLFSCLAVFNRASRNMTRSMFCFLRSLKERIERERDCSLSLFARVSTVRCVDA